MAIAIARDQKSGLIRDDIVPELLARIGGGVFMNLARMVALEDVQRTYFAANVTADSVLSWERSIKEQIPRMEAQAALLKNKLGFDWPFSRWNELLGEFPQGLTMQVVGDDGTGKTQLADIICEWWTKKRGRRGLYISTDMSRDMTEGRRLTRHSGLLKGELNPETMDSDQWVRLRRRTNY